MITIDNCLTGLLIMILVPAFAFGLSVMSIAPHNRSLPPDHPPGHKHRGKFKPK